MTICLRTFSPTLVHCQVPVGSSILTLGDDHVCPGDVGFLRCADLTDVAPLVVGAQTVQLQAAQQGEVGEDVMPPLTPDGQVFMSAADGCNGITASKLPGQVEPL